MGLHFLCRHFLTRLPATPLRPPQVGKLLGERWKALPAEDKVQYEEKARQDKTRYQAAMKEYAAKQSGKVDADAVAADDDDDDEEAADEE